MKEEKFTKINEFISQGATWKNNLVHELAKMKVVFGTMGTKSRLERELAGHNKNNLPTASYLMLLVSVLKKLQKLNISRETSDRLPLSFWLKFHQYVTQDNAKLITDYLHQNGELKILIEKFKNGYKISYNLFSDEHQFIKEAANENSENRNN